jgi:hypothetical protein
VAGIVPFEHVEILHDAVFPEEGAAAACATGQTHHLSPFVNPVSLAVVISRERAEILDTIVFSPAESMESRVIGVGVTHTGKPDDIALFIDRRGRDPMVGANVAEVNHPALFPKHRVTRSISSNRLIADTGNSDDLTSVIDRRGGAGGIAGDQRQFFNFGIVSSRFPDDGLELEDLRGYAGRITNRIFVSLRRSGLTHYRMSNLIIEGLLFNRLSS